MTTEAILKKINNKKAIWALTLDWMIIVMVIALAGYFQHWVFYLIAILVVGNRQHAIAILGHDAAHRTLFSNKKLNDIFGELLIFWPLSTTLNGYKNWHMLHHKNLGTANDSEHIVKRGWGNLGPMPKHKLVILFMTDIIGLGSWEIIRQINAVKPKKKIEHLNWLSIYILAGVLMYLSGTLWIGAIWLVSFYTSFWAMFRFRSITEHIGQDETIRFQPNFILKHVFFPHNTWCHYEHHKRPFIPSYNLPALRTILDSHVPILNAQQLFTYLKNVPELQNISNSQ